MSDGPWNDYAAQTPPPAPGPWNDFARQGGFQDGLATSPLTAQTPGQQKYYNAQKASGAGFSGDPGSALNPIYDQPGQDTGHPNSYHVSPEGNIILPAGQNPTANDALGFIKPIYNMGRNLRALNPLTPVTDAIETGVNSVLGPGYTIAALGNKAKADIFRREAEGQTPGIAGSLAGGLLAAAPTVPVAGEGLLGAVIGGALGGGLTSDAKSAQQVAGDVAGGVIGGGLTHGAIKAVGGLLSPTITPDAQKLIDLGMSKLTPGQMAGKSSVFGLGEKVGLIFPGTGELTRANTNAGLRDFNTVIANDVAKRFGGTASGETGSDLFNSVNAAKNAAYNIKIPNGALIDNAHMQDLSNIENNIKSLPKEYQDKFDALIKNDILARRDQNGVIPEKEITNAKNAISAEIDNFKNDTSGWARNYVSQLKLYRQAFMDNLGRQSPQAQAQIQAADAAYPFFKTYSRAVKNASQNSTTEDQFFTPQHFQSAINSQNGETAINSKSAPYGDIAEAAKNTLARKFYDIANPWSTAAESFVPLGVLAESTHSTDGAIKGLLGSALTALGASPWGQTAQKSLLTAGSKVSSSPVLQQTRRVVVPLLNAQGGIALDGINRSLLSATP